MDYSDDNGNCDGRTTERLASHETVASARRTPAQGNPLAPAYNFGWSQHLLNQDADWEQCEQNLAARWPASANSADLDWAAARDAVRAGWDHVRPKPSRTASD